MPQELPQPWLEPQRSSPGITVVHRMTAPNAHRFTDEICTMCGTIRRYLEKRGVQWRTFFAIEEVPAWKEQEYCHSDADIYKLNTRTISVTDGLIVHAWDNGSAALGILLKTALDAPHRMPILVLSHENDMISKAWTGAREEYPFLTFAKYRSDPDMLGSAWHEIDSVVEQWLVANELAIQTGPVRRKNVQQDLLAESERLHAAWSELGCDEQRTLAEQLALTRSAVERMLADPLLLGAAGVHKYLILVNKLAAKKSRIVIAARKVLTPEEFDEWLHWATDYSVSYAELILEYATQRRTDRAIIAQDPVNLLQPSGWETLAKIWRRKP